MSLEQFFIDIAVKSQQQEYCHKKLIKTLEKQYPIQENLPELSRVFNDILCGLCFKDFCRKNPMVLRGLEFLAKLTVEITLSRVKPFEAQNPDGTISQIFDISTDEFFTTVLEFILQYTSSTKPEVRQNVCFFVKVLLQQIGNNVELDNNLCNNMLESLVDLVKDPKVNIRLEAIEALVKLQETNNPECLVLKSFLPLFIDKNAEVRKCVIKDIAPHTIGIYKCKERLLDVDAGVRLAALRKLADVSPYMIRIVDRTFILNQAFEDEDRKVKQVLSENLLPKWLNCFKRNYVSFQKGLMLDADENDIKNYEHLCSQVIKTFLKTDPITEILKDMKIDEDEKVIPVKELNLESAVLWSILVNYLRSKEDREDYLTNILPDLTPFCSYIEKYIKEKSAVIMEEWDFLKYQSIISILFQIASGFDISDEVGKKKLYSLIMNTLPLQKFQERVIDNLVSIASKLNPNIDSFTMDICQVISEIREPWIDEEPTEKEKRDRNFELTKLIRKCYELEMAEETATAKKDYPLADSLHKEYLEYQKKVEDFKNSQVVKEKVRVNKDDPETLCRALDILIGLLRVNSVNRMTDALRTCKDEFLLPLLKNDIAEIYWRLVLCLGLYSMKDEEFAFEYTKIICLPISTYKTIANHDKNALKWSVYCNTDLIRKYGFKVLGIDEDLDSVSTTQSDQNQTHRRKLYSQDSDNVVNNHTEALSAELFTSTLIDMLDDEDEEIADISITSIAHLMVHERFTVSTELMMKLFLKWYNSSIWKKSNKVQQKIGIAIKYFTDYVKSSKEIIGKTILPIISLLNNLPAHSPLYEIDIDNFMRFSTALVDGDNYTGGEKVHNTIAKEVIETISNKPQDVCTPHLTKLLTYLNVQIDNPMDQRDLVSSAEILLGDMDKNPRRNILKFLENFKPKNNTLNTIDELNEETQESVTLTNTTKDSNKENTAVDDGDSTTKSSLNESNDRKRRSSLVNLENKRTRKGNGKLPGKVANKKPNKHVKESNDEKPQTSNNNFVKKPNGSRVNPDEKSEEGKSNSTTQSSPRIRMSPRKSRIPHHLKPYVLVERVPLKSPVHNSQNPATPLNKRQANTPLSALNKRTLKKTNINEIVSPKVKSPMVVLSKIPIRNDKTSSSTEKHESSVKTRRIGEKVKVLEEKSDNRSKPPISKKREVNVVRTRSKDNNKNKKNVRKENDENSGKKTSPKKINKTLIESFEKNGAETTENNNKNGKLNNSVSGNEWSRRKSKTEGSPLNNSIRTRSFERTSPRRRLERSFTESNIRRLSRKQLNFSTEASSDETILKTFLQSDEEYERNENLSIEDSSSISSTSHDSAKENLILTHSPSTATSSRTRNGSKKRANNHSRSPPMRKLLKSQRSLRSSQVKLIS